VCDDRVSGSFDLEEWRDRLLGARDDLRWGGLVFPSNGGGYATADECTDSKDCTVNDQRISHVAFAT